MSIRYDEYLRSPQWKLKCAAVRKRSYGWCERCIFVENVGWSRCMNPADDVHHGDSNEGFYRHPLGDEPLTDLIHLCRGCHRHIHKRCEIDPVVRQAVKVHLKLIKQAQKFDEQRNKIWDSAYQVGLESGRKAYQAELSEIGLGHTCRRA